MQWEHTVHAAVPGMTLPCASGLESWIDNHGLCQASWWASAQVWTRSPYAEPSKPRPTECGYMLSRAWMTCQWADSISWYWAIEIYRNRRIVVLIKSIRYRCVGAVPRAWWLIFFRTIISTLLNRNSDGNHIWRKQLWLRALCIGLANGDQGLNPAWTVCLWFFIHSCFIFRSLYSFLLRFDSVYINKILGLA